MSASVHALPFCGHERLFELRRAAQVAGCQFSRVKPKLHFSTGHVDCLPKAAADRRYFVADQNPIDPNDGGHAA